MDVTRVAVAKEEQMTNNPPEGWHPDPNVPNQLRYWNGSEWTEHSRPADIPAPTVPLASSGASTPWWRKRWVQVTGGVVAFLVIVGAIAGDPEEKKEDDTRKASEEPAAVVTVTETATNEPTEPTPSDTPEPSASATGRVGEEPTAKADADTFPMPNEVGKVLQVAQDDIQAVSGNPFFFTASEDATGEARFQVMDSNWVVCSQKPAAGKPVKLDNSTDVTFYVVKTGESCP